MKLVFMVRYNPFETYAGVEIFVKRLCEELSRRTYEVHVFCGGSKRVVQKRGFTLHQLPCSGIPFMSTFQFNYALRRELIQFLTRKEVDVVGCHGAGPASAFSELVRNRAKNRLPNLFVYHAHDCIASEMASVKHRIRLNPNVLLKYKLLVRNEKLACENADLVIAQSRATKEALLRHYFISERKVEIIPLGIPDDFSMDLSIDDPKEVCFLTIGAEERRDVKTFLEALRILRDEYQLNAKAIVVRDRNTQHAKFAKDWGLDVKFYWQISDHALKDFYRTCTAVVMPSLREGFGLPVIEAASFGKPSIVTNTGSFPELVNNGETGFIVNVGDTSALASKMYLVGVDNDLRRKMGANAKKCGQLFKISSIATKTLNIYSNFLIPM
jgi:glycosyltransferase involved in cell wall biosynthesis